jgi:hypothetical protein
MDSRHSLRRGTAVPAAEKVCNICFEQTFADHSLLGRQQNEVASLVDHPTNRQPRNRICELQEWNKELYLQM